MKTIFNLIGLVLIYTLFIQGLDIALEWMVLALMVINAFFVGIKWLKYESKS